MKYALRFSVTFLMIIALLWAPALVLAASVTAPITYNYPAQDCRPQTVTAVALAAKTGAYDLTTTGTARYLFSVLNSSDAAANVNVTFNDYTSAASRLRISNGTFVPNGNTIRFRNQSPAAGIPNVAKTLYLLKCH